MTQFKLELSAGDYQGLRMSLEVLVNNKTVYASPEVPPHIHCEFDSELPVTIQFVVGNKQPGETEVDAQGNIISDKHIKLDSITVDRMPVERWILESRLVEFLGKKTNYFYSNGTATIVIPNQDSFGFFLDLMTKIDQ